MQQPEIEQPPARHPAPWTTAGEATGEKRMKTKELKDLADVVHLDLLRRVDARRQELGLEKTELAERCGLSRSLVQRAAQGSDIQLSNFVQLALGVNLMPVLDATKDSGSPNEPQDLVHRG